MRAGVSTRARTRSVLGSGGEGHGAPDVPVPPGMELEKYFSQCTGNSNKFTRKILKKFKIELDFEKQNFEIKFEILEDFIQKISKISKNRTEKFHFVIEIL